MTGLLKVGTIAFVLFLGFPIVSISGQSSIHDVIKTKNSERFVVDYDASNAYRRQPLVYDFSKPIPTNWQLTIQNNLTYSNSENTKTVIKIQEPAPSEKFIELAMFGDKTGKFWAAINTNESGYIRVYEREKDGWSRDQPIFVAHANNQGLTITNGKRIIIDKLSVNDFIVGSVSIYGKDETTDPDNSNSGTISFDIIFGNPAESPLYYVPLITMIAIGSIVLVLIIRKKRD
ncbi:MAG TPA: hypothetical protein VLD84_04350 [Nitrososphaeraceae archaeon]|nr:hypothetical protein [Nitrososphaeraceae archaeon]